MQLENKKALVTGAAGGIGQAIVARLPVEGAMVAASDLDLAASAADVLIPAICVTPATPMGWPRWSIMRSAGSTSW